MSGELTIAIEAAVMVEAGKHVLGKLALPSVRRLWRSRFGGIDAPDVATAMRRLTVFMEEIDARLVDIEGRQLISTARLSDLISRPELTGCMYAAFETAIETGDSFKLKILAELVIARLQSTDDGIDAAAARISIERMRDVTSRQVRLVALIALLHLDPMQDQYRDDGQYEERALQQQHDIYVAWLERHVEPLIDIPVDFGDFLHLRGLGLLDFTMWEHTSFESGFTPTVLNATVVLFPNLGSEPQIKNLIRKIAATADPDSRRSGIPMLAAATLSPAGELIAIHALRETSGLE